MLIFGDWVVGQKRCCLAALVSESVALGNLEGAVLPAAEHNCPAEKAGPHIYSESGPSFFPTCAVSLANNHIMDYGEPGLKSTLRSLQNVNIRFIGAGENLSEARRTIVVEDKGVRIGIIACCEAQFGVARRDAAGVAEFGPWVYSTIHDLRKSVDAVIVSAHAAVEDSPWPYPYLRDLYRSYIDAGAKVVHGHHAHVPQGYEAYGDGVIFYGMGNFAVDPNKWRDYPNGLWSLAAHIEFQSTPLRWRLATLEIREGWDSNTITVEESTAVERAHHDQYMDVCNRPLSDAALFDALWQEVALRAFCHHGADYMRFAPDKPCGRRAQVREALKLFKDAAMHKSTPSFQPRQHEYLLWYHMVACESHRQMLATALGVLSGEIPDLRTAESGRLADEMMPWSKGVCPE